MLRLEDGAWSGKRCFILGGGPSLKGFDSTRLKGELTIGVNMAFLMDPTITLIRDLRLMSVLYSDSRWKAYKGITVWLNSEIPNEPGRFPGVVELKEAINREGRNYWSSSLRDGLWRGTNTGTSALNLADILCADTVYLLGFDLNSKGNWHNEYPQEWMQEWVGHREYLQEWELLARIGVIRPHVVNLTPSSSIRSFPFGELDDVLSCPHKPVRPKLVPPSNDRAVFVSGFEGLGDTFYVRPVIKLIEREGVVYLRTPWPQIFWDLPQVRPVRPSTELRTQRANVDLVERSLWYSEPKGLKEYRYFYNTEDFKAGMTPIEAFLKRLNLEGPVDFSMRPNPEWLESSKLVGIPSPIGIIHQPTIRSEWPNTSRNPKAEYLQALVDAHPEIHWVSVGWHEKDREWPDGPPLKGIYRSFDRGELRIEEVMALVAKADLALSGPCFLLPMACALGTPVFVVFGGSVPPKCLVDKAMGQHVAWVAPEPFCACMKNDHPCNKDIEMDRLLGAFNRFVECVLKTKRNGNHTPQDGSSVGL